MESGSTPAFGQYRPPLHPGMTKQTSAVSSKRSAGGRPPHQEGQVRSATLYLRLACQTVVQITWSRNLRPLAKLQRSSGAVAHEAMRVGFTLYTFARRFGRDRYTF